jgi:hypothetical protein
MLMRLNEPGSIDQISVRIANVQFVNIGYVEIVPHPISGTVAFTPDVVFNTVKEGQDWIKANGRAVRLEYRNAVMVQYV